MDRMKIGIFGVGRGMDIAKNFMLLNCDIVALCDNRKDRMERALKQMNEKDVAVYDNFDDFIEHDMDAVVLANFFHEHAPYAIKCFEKGIHVFSECISNGTMAEGIELIKAFEKSNSIYMLAENYPQMLFNREIKRICDGKTLGKIMYAEGEYNHPGNPNDSGFKKQYNYFQGHWRNYLPRTYYVTHSLGPIMHATGATPKVVSAHAVFAPIEGDVPTASYGGDRAAIIMTKNDDGSVFRFTGCAAFGGHHNAYRVCGTDGQIQNVGGLDDKVILRYNDWTKPDGAAEVNIYKPSWNDKDEKFIEQSGHGGSDYLTARYFLDCIREGKQPEHPFDVYSAVNMSSVAILGHRSVLENGKAYEIPDFTKDEWCKMYENDRITPFIGPNGEEPTIQVCTKADFKPTDKQIELFEEALK